MQLSKTITYHPGFKLLTDLKPKPNKIIYSKPKYVNNILTSTGT